MNGLKLFGHPLHPAMVHFPVAAWTGAVVTDALFAALGGAAWRDVSFWLIVVGVVTALGAMTAGFIDLMALPEGQAAQRRALRHMSVMGGAWTAYVIDLLVRLLPTGPASALINLSISIVGFLTLLLGTHYGAQLVYDFGVGQTGHRPS